jgi:hypothetical protein
VLPHQEASYVRHIALDIGGSLIKLVYFSPDTTGDSADTAATAIGLAAGSQHKGGMSRLPHFCRLQAKPRAAA